MAISGGDGSIILTTSVDTSGISKGSISIRSALQGVDTMVKKVQNSFSAFREQKVTLATLNQAIKDQQYVLNSLNLEYAEYVARGKAGSTQAKELKANIDAATAEMKEMQAAAQTLGAKGSTSINKIGTAMKTLLSYFIGIQTIFKVINFSGEAAQFATQTEASVQRLIDIYGEAAQSVGNFIDANARAIVMSKASATSFASVYGNLFGVWADQATNAELTNRYLNMTAVVASKTGRTVQDVQERVRSGLLGNTEAIEDLGVFVNVKTIEMTDAFQRMANGKSWEQLDAYTQQQVRTIAILEQATAKYGNTVADTTATTRAQYQAAYEDFKNTWGQVVNTVLVPVLKVLTQVFTIATKGLQVIAGLTGKTVDNSKIQENSSSGVVDNQKELTKEIEKTNKAQKKSLAAFDEINILSQETAKNSSDTGGANVPITGGGGGESYNNSFVDKISGDMAAIMAVIGGALVAVGLLLIFFGHIGWGIGFIITGASVFSVAMATLSSGDQVTPISEQLMKILAIAGTALAALGLILLFSGVWKLGIAFLVAGASALAVSIVAVKKGKATKEAEEMLLDIMLIAGTAMLALGVILLCFGVVSPLSIGLVVAGAASLAGAVAINPTKTFNEIKKFFKDNAGLIVGISLAILVLGILLCCCGIITPLSIGMIVFGAGGLVATVALNWKAITTAISNFFKNNAGLVVGISLALLVLGIILLVTGVGIPLGIGLVAAGAAGLVATVALNWKAITTAISDFFNKNSGLIVGVSLALLVLGILLLVTGVGIPLGIALIAAGAVGLAAVVALNWNTIKEKVSNAFNAVVNWVKTWGLLVLGIILCISGVGIPLGIALMKKGGANLAEAQDPLWTTIVDKVKETWNAIKTFWNTHIAKWFTKEHWAGLAKNMMNGLIGKIEAGLNKILEKFHNANIGKAVDFIAGGLGFDIPKSIKIPRLAKGAVIPPNREFLAVLGDNKKENEIVSPVSTMKQAFTEAMLELGGSFGGNTEVVLEIDGREFGRAVVEQGNRENRRIGTRLVIA